MTEGRQWRFWLFGGLIFLGLLWLLRDVLSPFVAGMAVAYLLDPLVDRLERGRIPRWLATTLVLLAFVLVAILALALLFPLLRGQIVQLVEAVPDIVAWIKSDLLPRVEALVLGLAAEEVEQLRAALQEYAGSLVGWLGNLVRGLLSGGVALIDVLSILLITPVVAFYLLRDWDQLVATVDGWLPRHHREIIRAQIREVDRTLAGFVRGQATVCVSLAAIYGLGLSLTGLNFGLVIGTVAGLISFIPYAGTAIGLIVGLAVAFAQFDEAWRIGVVAGVFLFGQIIEGYFLTPRLVGDRVGLHPVWIIFALMAAGTLFGFVGVLLAVPIAAVIGVMIRFGLSQYLVSSYYTGPVALEPQGPTPGRPLHPAAEGALGHVPADLPPVEKV